MRTGNHSLRFRTNVTLASRDTALFLEMMFQPGRRIGGEDMNLARMTETYQRGGRQELVAAVEQFSVAIRTVMLADIKVALRDRSLDTTRRDVLEEHASIDLCSY